jgi:hypothetical protein
MNISFFKYLNYGVNFYGRFSNADVGLNYNCIPNKRGGSGDIQTVPKDPKGVMLLS